MTEAPCYDSATKTDCPRRRVGCRTDCVEWKKFEQFCAERREKRQMTWRARVEPNEYCLRRHYRNLKKKRRGWY